VWSAPPSPSLSHAYPHPESRADLLVLVLLPFSSLRYSAPSWLSRKRRKPTSSPCSRTPICAPSTPSESPSSPRTFSSPGGFEARGLRRTLLHALLLLLPSFSRALLSLPFLRLCFASLRYHDHAVPSHPSPATPSQERLPNKQTRSLKGAASLSLIPTRSTSTRCPSVSTLQHGPSPLEPEADARQSF
jgi:hypothetical protein